MRGLYPQQGCSQGPDLKKKKINYETEHHE